MPCGSCGAENPPGTKFCANCGTALAQEGAAQGFGGTVVPPAPRQPSSVSIDFRRLGTGDIIAAGGSVLLFISLFLPWYSVTGEGVSYSTSATREPVRRMARIDPGSRHPDTALLVHQDDDSSGFSPPSSLLAGPDDPAFDPVPPHTARVLGETVDRRLMRVGTSVRSSVSCSALIASAAGS